MTALQVKHFDGHRYIRADVAEAWKRERDMLADHISNIHKEVHLAKRALNASRKENEEET